MSRMIGRLSPIALVATVTFCVSACGAAASGHKNVLVFFIDDLRPELNCYGSDYIHSPSIDELASQGVRFKRAYCQQALCAPSRISMMTGQYPDTTGITDLFTPLLKVQPEALTLPRYFKDRGYATCSFGKVYHHTRDDRENWSELSPRPARKYADRATLQAIDRRVAEGKKNGVAIEQLRVLGKGPPVENADVEDEAYADGQVAEQTRQALRRYHDKPFFICVGFAKPHLPFAAPARFWNLYDREQFTVPDRTRPPGAPKLAFTRWGELRGYRGMPQKGPLTDEKTKELRHGYAASVSFVDAQVGKVMAELDRLALRENTIVVLWGDHGYKLGDFGGWCKHTNFELDTRVPLIVSAPGFTRGKHTSELVEIVDLFPTLADLTGGDTPESCEGRSLRPVLSDTSSAHRNSALSQYPRGSTMGYSLRTERWRYTEWLNADKQTVSRELYDHSDSDAPIRNIANEPKHAKLVSMLSKQLSSRARRVGEEFSR